LKKNSWSGDLWGIQKKWGLVKKNQSVNRSSRPLGGGEKKERQVSREPPASKERKGTETTKERKFKGAESGGKT